MSVFRKIVRWFRECKQKLVPGRRRRQSTNRIISSPLRTTRPNVCPTSNAPAPAIRNNPPKPRRRRPTNGQTNARPLYPSVPAFNPDDPQFNPWAQPPFNPSAPPEAPSSLGNNETVSQTSRRSGLNAPEGSMGDYLRKNGSEVQKKRSQICGTSKQSD